MRALTAVVLAATIAGMTVWGAAAIYYAPLPGGAPRVALAAAFVLATPLAFLLLPHRRRTTIGFLVVFGGLVGLYLRIPASNDRDWQPDVAVTPYTTIDGELVTIHGVRNFDYRTETDFDVRWETRTYDLRTLESADIIAVYWAGKAIAHTMVSFGFGGDDYLAVSIETRKERGERYSAIAGFFRQYELAYVFADERDVIRVRTTYRQPQEDVYLYRLRTPRPNIRRVFLEYARAANQLRDEPQFYNTLVTNCTTSILWHTRVNPESPPMSWKVLLSGYLPDHLYKLGRIDTSRSFVELERLSRVNRRAQAADRDPAFSRRIRDGLPMPGPLPDGRTPSPFRVAARQARDADRRRATPRAIGPSRRVPHP